MGYEGDSIHPECVADLAKQIEYLGPIDLMLYYSEDKLAARSFGEEALSTQSSLRNTQVSENIPNWVKTLVERQILSDETQLIQFGYSEDTDFYKYSIEPPKTSAWNVFPTPENPLTRYKFTSFEVNFSPHLKTIYR